MKKQVLTLVGVLSLLLSGGIYLVSRLFLPPDRAG